MPSFFRPQSVKSDNRLPAEGGLEPPVLAGRSRARRWLIRGCAAVTAVALGLVALVLPAQQSSADAGQFMMEFSSYGPNQEIVILVGSLSPGCDGIFRVSDIYVVPHGSVSGGDALVDVTGTPNMVTANLLGQGFAAQTIGYTAPGGNIGPGVYDIVEDVCLDGVFNAGEDSIMSKAFTVVGVNPLNPPSIESTQAILNIKAAAGEQAEYYEDRAAAWSWFWILYGHAGLPDFPDGPDAIIQALVQAAICTRLPSVAAFVCVHSVMHLPNLTGVANLRDIPTNMGQFYARVYRGLEADPPDQNYTAPVALGAVDGFGSGEGSELQKVFEELYHSQWSEGVAAEAFLHALEKYQGAQQASDAAAALAQAKAASAFARQAVAGLQSQAQARQRLLALEQSLGGWMKPDMAAALAEVHERLKAGGSLTAAEVAALEDLGANQTQREQFVQAVIAEAGLATPYVSLADLDAEASAVGSGLVSAYGDAVSLFDGIVTDLEAGLSGAGLSAYPSVTLSGPSTGSVGSTAAVTAATDAGNTVAWDTDADGDFDDGTGATAQAALAHLGPNAVGARVTDASGRQTVAYHVVAAAQPASRPLVTAANPVVGTAITADDADVVTFSVTPGHTDSLPVTVTWHVNGAAAGTGNQLQMTASAAAPIQHVEAELADSNGATEWAAWSLFTAAGAPTGGSGLEARFSSEASTGLVDVAWDRVGGLVVAASSVYSTSSGYAAANVLNAYSSSSYWNTANNQATNQWVVIDLGAEWDVA
ncbi:MAG: hypothetical protein LBC97_09500, partial [Bifidobacteriaceae bacterium]|nr:hypothetical protein [Bifidobacteriaceae bacterium]